MFWALNFDTDLFSFGHLEDIEDGCMQRIEVGI